MNDAPLLEQTQALNIDVSAVWRKQDAQTAEAMIITDPNGDQFTAFYPGPEPEADEWMMHLRSHVTRACEVFIQAPLRADLMRGGFNVAQLHNLPVIWCPGQYADQLHADDIEAFVEAADILIGNEHEIAYLSDRLNSMSCTVIQSAGPHDVRIQMGSETWSIPITTPAKVAVDPTGCGDALIAGIVHRLAQAADFDWHRPSRKILSQAVECGIAAAQRCLGQQGSQVHDLTGLELQ